MARVPDLEAVGLSVAYTAGTEAMTVLRGIDLSIPAGSFVTVLGPSGSGKTTLLNVFAGFVRPTTGIARFRGAPIAAPSAERAVVFQGHALLPWLDVAENVAFPLKLRGVDRSRRRQRVLPLLRQVGLADFAGHPVWALSGGMQQRVGLARALAADPAVLLLDEPLGALDAITREGMQRLLLELWATSGKTALLITHDIEEAILLGTQLIVLSDRPGTIVARETLAFGTRVAAGEDPRTIRNDPEFNAAKGRLRDLMHDQAAKARPEPEYAR
ncbi:MAG: ABC transporter ATP-binding protein [Rhizobiales bacterium]|nr:ABC transporter ATP-binding protein [Hyphomicrobiales bacterium]